ncbi:MAG: DUF4349 domain-containing protein [Thermoleophilaceae bacterium]
MNEETTTILIDTALASGSASALDPEERALQELVLAVRADAPVPDPDFKLRMDARVAAGFPQRRGAFRAPSFAFKRPQLAALGVAASLLIALIVVASGPSNHEPRVVSAVSKTAPAGGSLAAVPEAGAHKALRARSHAAGGAPPTAEALPTPTRALDRATALAPPVGPTPTRHRRVERSAALTLAAPKDKLSQVGDQVVAVTDRYRGFVLNSSVTTAGDEGSGSFDLRIPARSLQSALRDLSGLADVQSRTENAQDITSSFASARTRIQELDALRSSLLKQLAAATTDRAANAIRYRIRLVNGQLEAQTRVMTQLRRRADYASVSVTLATKQGGTGGGGGIHKGLRDLRNSLLDAANLSLRVLGVALPIGLVLALLWLAGSRYDRRRREAALDA